MTVHPQKADNSTVTSAFAGLVGALAAAVPTIILIWSQMKKERLRLAETNQELVNQNTKVIRRIYSNQKKLLSILEKTDANWERRDGSLSQIISDNTTALTALVPILEELRRNGHVK